ncbi:tyrosine-type recombinase/integrase [Candidatus Riflebacteria bacterium]
MLKNIKKTITGSYEVTISKGSYHNRFKKQFTAPTITKLKRKVLDYLKKNPNLIPEKYLNSQPERSQSVLPAITQKQTNLPLLRTVIPEFLKEKSIRRSRKTLCHYKDRLYWFGKWYGHFPISAIDDRKMNDYIERRQKPYIPRGKHQEVRLHNNTISREIKDFNTLLRFAERNGWIKNPRFFEPLQKEENKIPVRIVDADEFIAIVKHIEYKPAQLCLMFIRFCGLRKQEALQMRHDWIDVKRGTLTIRSEGKFKTKTRKCRIIHIPTPLLEEYQKLHKDSITYVFPSKVNPGIPITDLRSEIKRACNMAGSHQFNLKDLRHSFNTTLAEKGFSAKVRSVLMGHSNPRITETVYTHAREKNLVDAMNASMPDLE